MGDVPGWLVEVRTILVMKDSKKGTEAGNYRPIACLSLIRKLLTGIISDKTYDHLEKNRLLPEEQKRSKESANGKKDKFTHDLGGLQEGLRYGPPLMDQWEW